MLIIALFMTWKRDNRSVTNIRKTVMVISFSGSLSRTFQSQHSFYFSAYFDLRRTSVVPLSDAEQLPFLAIDLCRLTSSLTDPHASLVQSRISYPGIPLPSRSNSWYNDGYFGPGFELCHALLARSQSGCLLWLGHLQTSIR
jgi:hypothetical protein